MELRCGVARLVIWPRRCVLELGCYHLAGSDCGLVAAHTRLREFLEYFQCFIDGFSVCTADSLILCLSGRERLTNCDHWLNLVPIKLLGCRGSDLLRRNY